MTQDVLISFFLLGVLLPAVVSGVVYLSLKSFQNEMAAPLAIATGFIAGFFGISGLGGYAFPPKTVQNWFPHITLAALLLGLVESRWLKQVGFKWGLRAILLTAFLWQIFQPFINHPFPSRSWTNAQTFWNLALSVLVIFIFWWGLDMLTRNSEKFSNASRANAILPTGLMIIGAGSAISVILAHSLVMGQLTGAVTATLGAVAVVIWLFKAKPLSQTVTPLITMLLVLPWLSIYTSLPLWAVLALAVSPWLLVFLFEEKALLQRTFYRLGLVALPVLVAVIFAWQLS